MFLVSSIKKYTYNAPRIQAMAKMHMQPCKPMMTVNVGNNFKQTNDTIFRNTLHMVKPIVRICKEKKFLLNILSNISNRLQLTFDGRFSTIHTKMSGTIPAEAMNITNDKLVTGIHSYADKLQPLCLRYEYNENEIRPNAEPSNEISNNIFLPNESER